jgi:transglutaminase-like putative cysteine protease
MRFTLTHRTAYAYAGPVHESFNEVRLQPVSGETQTCLAFDLSIDPPATVISFQDYYVNSVHNFSIPYLHDHLTIEATSDVITFADATTPLAGPPRGEADRSPPLAHLAADPLVADEQAEFLSPSTYVALEDASHALARSLLAVAPRTTAFAFLERAAAYIRERFTYRLGTTNVHSTVAEVIAGGSGVCQDYAHLLLSLCRHVGLPARYVSGYLGDVAQSGASHAWVEAFVPPYGWIGIDPTLGATCTGRHVKIAVGRDYADVAVVRGTYRGSAEATLDVAVRGVVRGDAHDLAAARAGDGGGRGRLIQYQTLGAMQQFQRLGAMSQTLGTTSQFPGTLPDGTHGQSGEPDAPRQQPQQ